MRLVTFAIAATLTLAGCPKNGGDSTIVQIPDDDGSATVDAGTEPSKANLPPESQLLALLDEIVTRVTKAEDCDELASALSNWTNRNKKTITKLIDAISSGEAVGDEAAEIIDEQVVAGYLVVVEAAADCGSNDDAMNAYDAFTVSVEKATY
jgi:hypothetical protein